MSRLQHSLTGSLQVTGSISASEGFFGVVTGTTSGTFSGSASGSFQGDGSGLTGIDHNELVNYAASRHVDHASVIISGSSGLTGGGDLQSSRTIILDTTSTEFTSGVKTKLNTENVVSSSSQIGSDISSSLLLTSSLSGNTLIFTKGNYSTYNIDLSTIIPNVNTSSLLITASLVGTDLQFSKGDSTTFNVDLSGFLDDTQVSTGSLLTTGSALNDTITLTKGDSTTFDLIITEVTSSVSASHSSTAPYSGLYGTVPTWNQNTTGNADTATSASYASNASTADSATTATTSTSASYANTSDNAVSATAATSATSASYALNASTADSATTATSASHADTAPYSGLYGAVPTWNQNTTGNAATATSASYASNASTADLASDANTATSASHANAAPYSGLYGTIPTWNQNTTGNADTATSASYASNASTADLASDANTATSASHAANAPYSGLYGTVPTWNQNTTGNAATATSASYASNASTADFASIAGALSTGDKTVNGNLTVTGTVTAQEFHTEYVSSSIIYESGSTQFGDTGDDNHTFKGNVSISGSTPLTLINLSAQNTEATSLMVDTNGVVGTRELGSLAFSSATYDNYASWTISDGTTSQLINSLDTLTVSAGTGLDVAVSATDTLQYSLDLTEVIATDGSNRVLTSDGDGTLTAESALSFDSSKLTISGDISASGAISGSTLNLDNQSLVFDGTNLTISGTGTVTANNFITTSDKRLKSDITPIQDGLEVLKKIVAYEYKKFDIQDAGYIAQEVQQVLPYAVSEGQDGYLKMYDRPILAHIHKAILQLEERIAAIEQKI